mmetsp:Transcript_305/g.751  ORF Transcript_305/g.751 Transcript_305/m.751 type:complete len:206 (+) Transcript_305:332-949(+)
MTRASNSSATSMCPKQSPSSWHLHLALKSPSVLCVRYARSVGACSAARCASSSSFTNTKNGASCSLCRAWLRSCSPHDCLSHLGAGVGPNATSVACCDLLNRKGGNFLLLLLPKCLWNPPEALSLPSYEDPPFPPPSIIVTEGEDLREVQSRARKHNLGAREAPPHAKSRLPLRPPRPPRRQFRSPPRSLKDDIAGIAGIAHPTT